MRVNLFVAQATGMSRRAADNLLRQGSITINGQLAKLGDQVQSSDVVTLNSQRLSLPEKSQTILLNKPVGYVCSRDGQGSKTIYDLLPAKFQRLKPVGRLDKDSSGLLLLTSDGQLAHQLTHPSFNKQKIYQVVLNRPLSDKDKLQIERGVNLDDGLSRLQLAGSRQPPPITYLVTMSEGRNRQIRRTFEALGYKVVKLHRQQFGDYKIGRLTEGKYLLLT